MSQLKPSVLYSIGARVGGGGLSLVASHAIDALVQNQMLDKALCYGASRGYPSKYLTHLYFQPAKLFSHLPSKYYYRMKREWMDWRTAQYLKHSAANIYHGWTHESLRSIRVAKSMGMLTILERGNPHPNYVKKIHDEEACHYGRKSNFIIDDKNPFMRYFNHCRYEMDEAITEINEADYVFVNSDFCARTYIDNGVNRQKIIVIPRGFEVDQFSPRSLQKKDDKFILLFVGQLMIRKGVKYLLDAWRELNLPNAELWFVGAVTKELDHIVDRERDAEMGIQYLGHVKNPAQYYQSASAFILPSLDEGSAKVTYEAMASNLPCILTEETGSIADQTNAILIPTKSSDVIKSAILKLYHDCQYRNDLGARARTAVSKYTWTYYQQSLIDKYTELLNR